MIGWKYFSNVGVRKTLSLGKGALLKVTGSDGSVSNIDLTELGVLDGLTATASELNILDGCTATAAELNMAADISTNIEIVTTTNVITAAESGKTFILNAATGFVSTLPAAATGLRFKFIIGNTAPSSGNHTIVTTSLANTIKGGISGAEVDTGSDFDFSSADDTITFVASSAVSGDWIEVISDATNYYVSGWSRVRAGLTLTQAD